jgi:hypothetical protein
MSGLRLRVGVNNGDNNQPESPDLLPTVTTFDFAAAGIPLPEWSQVNEIVFEYTDLLGNEYVLNYDKTFTVQIETRLENVYGSFTPPSGSRERIINAFVDVPFNSVDTTTACPDISGPPFPASIQNRNPVPDVIPYDSPACMDRTSTMFFPNGTVPVDIFSRRDNLGAVLAPLPVGTVFEFNVSPFNPVGLPTQIVTTTLRNAEADPLVDFISIPNTSTPTLKPAGFRIVDAKLGQNLTVSWTRPTSFEIGSVMLTANVTAVPSGGQSSPAFTLPPLTCSPSSIDVPIAITSATFKFPTSCFGIPVTQAQFCIFITGTAATQNKRTTACWFFE